jgi:hypothetical protein
MQLHLRGWLDPKTRFDAFLGGTPWSAMPFGQQDRRNVKAQLTTWFHEKATRCKLSLKSQ